MARKILLADDSVTAQNMGRKILADAGYEVITVNNGSAALKKIGEQKPDLIVLDVYMPGYSGLEVCQRLKEAQETARIPILLTVGKLEPFKPEEAKRMRADAFIVKPFEASELLSAVTKLEDKIVPRGESSKPGRFARTIAAVEEGRYDKTMAVEEDAGWKNRISFPTKKKKPAGDEEADDSIYSATSQDSRRGAERKSARKSQETTGENRVDLGALAPEGLPKDVTPEEIAALAAAAAQMKGKVAEDKAATAAEGIKVESKAVDASSEEKTEEKLQRKEEGETAIGLPQDVPAEVGTVAAFAEQKPEEKTAFAAEQSREMAKEAGTTAVPASEVIAALAGLEHGSGESSDTMSGNGSSSPGAPGDRAAEPVTMAVAAAAASGETTQRWTAVSAALDPDESAISLEHEMQKAYAAFAAAENGYAGSAVIVSDVPTNKTPPPISSSIVESAMPESVASVPATPAPEAAQTLSAVASAATEAISAAVKEFETVAASYIAPEVLTPAPVDPIKAAEAVIQPVADAASPASVPEGSVLHTAGSTVSESPLSVGNGPADQKERVIQDETAPSAGTAAMAAAAGAEKAPEEVPPAADSESGEIASIVDSVLADMRPRIVAEISRKLGKKK